MTETQSINDMGPEDFDSIEEFEHWLKVAVAELERNFNLAIGENQRLTKLNATLDSDYVQAMNDYEIEKERRQIAEAKLAGPITFKKLEDEIEALRKLALDYIQAYEKLAFGDAVVNGS